MSKQFDQDPRGLFSPDSITWKIHSDPAMAVGGIRALLQQALQPAAMDGVAKNSNFREDAWGRLQRTGDYVSTLTFAEPKAAHALAARVRKIHSSLGLDDPHLLLWVHMSMVDSFLDISRRSGLQLTDAEADQYLTEMVTFAKLVGIPEVDVPATVDELAQYMRDIYPELIASEEAKKTSVFLLFPPMPKLVRFITPATPLWAGVATLAGASLPDWARDLYGWPSIPGQNIATDISLRTFRNATMRLPQSLRESPLTKKAREKAAK